MRETVRQCLAMLPAPQRRRWLLLPVLGVLTGAAEAGAAVAVFALIGVISDPAALGRSATGAWLLAHLPRQGGDAVIVQLTVLVALYHVGKNLLLAGAQHLRHRIVGESSAALAGQMLHGYLLAPYPFHFRRDSAELIRNTTRSVDAVFVALSSLAAIGAELAVGAGIVVVLVAAAPLITLIAGVVLTVVVVGLLRATRRLARRAGGGEHALDREMLQTLQHALGAVKEIKALGREDFFYRAFAEQQRARLSLGHLGVTLEALPPLIIETVFVCGALLVVVLTTVLGGRGGAGMPLLGLFAYAGFRIVPMANRITWRLTEVRAREVPIQALYDDYVLVADAPTPEQADGPTPLRLDRAITLADVSFVYPGAPAPALRDVSLTVRRGESLGIVGPTGAGKSTLVDLIVGLLPPTTGRVCVDGRDLGGRARAWRRHVGYVPQAIVLLDDTLRRNVALGIADREIDDARVLAALRTAQLDPATAGLPRGLDTLVGERGVRLAGGERQRVGLARALYHDPDVLVLDEATAALDTATEAAIADALRALRGRKTVLLIAHRFSTVCDCDRIAVIADGRLADCGTYDELMARSALFRRLAG